MIRKAFYLIISLSALSCKKQINITVNVTDSGSKRPIKDELVYLLEYHKQKSVPFSWGVGGPQYLGFELEVKKTDPEGNVHFVLDQYKKQNNYYYAVALDTYFNQTNMRPEKRVSLEKKDRVQSFQFTKMLSGNLTVVAKNLWIPASNGDYLNIYIPTLTSIQYYFPADTFQGSERTHSMNAFTGVLSVEVKKKKQGVMTASTQTVFIEPTNSNSLIVYW